MKSRSSPAWTASQSEELYGFKRWGAGHLAVDGDGLVTVQPRLDGRSIRVLDVVQEAVGMGLKAPLKQGEKVPLTLVFEKAGSVDVELAVVAMGATPGHEHK